MGVTMPGVESRDFSTPDETRTPEKTKVELVSVGGGQIGRYTFQPGWRWSECIKPVAGTESCQVEHVGYVVSGRLHVKHEDGSENEVKPGDVYRIAPGHEGWVVGDEPAVMVEFQGAAGYAKPAS
jgi:quercetin dioxygenase-like cupin family protein